MKKIMILGVLLSMVTLCCCNHSNGNKSEEKSSDNTEAERLDINETFDSVTITNADVRLIFDKTNGSLKSFVNMKTNNDYIKNTIGGNWAMLITKDTDDVFEAKPSKGSNVMITSRNQEASFSKETGEDFISLKFSYNVTVADNSFVEVNNVIRMEKDVSDISFKYEVKNNMSKGVVISFTGAQLSGLKSNDKQWDLFWPSYEGKIYKDAIKKSQDDDLDKLSMVYPVPAACQLMQLYNNQESLYYFVKDTTREYKDLNFGPFLRSKEYDNGVENANRVSMSVTQYPFIKKGETKNIFETIIGLSQYGDYFEGSKKYSKFLTDSGMVKTKTEMSKTFNGYTPLIIDREGAKNFATYTTPSHDLAKTTITNYIDKFDDTGINGVNLLGWHEGGFDHKYPDYKFIPENDGNGYGENNFKTAMRNLDNDGKYAFAYINLHIADVESEWADVVADSVNGRTNIERAAIKNKNYSSETYETLPHNQFIDSMKQENYGTTTYYYAMCPKAVQFQDAIVDAVVRLRKTGIDGIWFDQLMQMPANLCFDPHHGHSTPATAYGEGYSELLTRVDQAMVENGDGEFLHSAEGVCDAYVQWIDACGYLWSRPFGALDTDDGVNYVPEITRASIPAVFLGQDGAGAFPNDEDEYARAFTMFDPFLVSTELDKVSKFTTLYDGDSTYLNGEYIAQKGIKSSNDDLVYGASFNKEHTKLIINVYNFTNNSSSGTLSLDLNRLGLKGIKSMSVALGQSSKYSINDSVITFNDLSAREVGSLKLSVE